MSQVVRCDGCGTTAREPSNWFLLESFGRFQIRAATGDDETKHFCSLECVRTWASLRIADELGVAE